jgi:hypothetical protein
MCWRLLPVVAFNVLYGVFLVRSGYGLFGVALSSSVSFVLLFVVMSWFLWSRAGESLSRYRGDLVSMLQPLAVMFLLVGGVEYGLPALAGRWMPPGYWGRFLLAASGAGLYAAIYWTYYHRACRHLDMLQPLRVRNLT